MRIAISCEGDSVSSHFGRCSFFTIIEIEDGELKDRQIISNPGHRPGFLPQFLQEKGIDCIVTGGMGERAQSLFSQIGIQVILGITGRIDEVIDKLIKGELEEKESLCERRVRKEKIHYNLKKQRKSTNICITATADNLDSQVDPRFGRCRYFIIVNPDTLEFEAIRNPNFETASGAGIKSAQFIIDKDIKTILTGDIGPNALEVLREAGIQVITGISGRIEDVIREYKEDKGR